MERKRLKYKNKTSTYAEYDMDYLYLTNHQIRIAWKEIMSIILINLRPEERIIEITTTENIEPNDSISLLNKLKLVNRNYYCNYNFELVLNNIKGDFEDIFQSILAVWKNRKEIKEKSEDNKEVFYLNKHVYSYLGLLRSSFIFILFIITLLLFFNIDKIKFTIYLLGLMYILYTRLKPIFNYIERLYTPYLEIDTNNIYYKNRKLIIPFSEIIEIEEQIAMLKIKTTNKIVNKLKPSIFNRHKTEFKIYNTFTNSEKEIDKTILKAYKQYQIQKDI